MTLLRTSSVCLIAALAAAAISGAPAVAESQDPAKPHRGSLLDPLTDPGAPHEGAPRTRESADATYAEQRDLWLLGDLLYGREYRGAVTLTNQCASQQRLGLFAYDLPDLAIVPSVTLEPGETIRLPYVTTPRVPSSGAPASIRGEMVIWRPGSGPTCPPLRFVHVARGQLRTATPEDERDERAALEHAALDAVCVTWWLRGQSPAAASSVSLPEPLRTGAKSARDATCVEVVRQAAQNFRQRLSENEAKASPQAWAWLPAAAAVERMSMNELVAFRRRVVDQSATVR